jgi:hypothetical protein
MQHFLVRMLAIRLADILSAYTAIGKKLLNYVDEQIMLVVD